MATTAAPDDEPDRVAPGVVTGRPARRTARHRHRADGDPPGGRRARLWALAAVSLTAFLGAAAFQRTPRPGEGVLGANGFLLTHAGIVPGVSSFSPDGVAALHLALYATLTRAFSRNEVLVTAGRELLLISSVLSAVLLWRVTRRFGLGHGASSVAIVLAALPLLFAGTALLDVPAQLAVPWSLAAAGAATAGRRKLRLVLALPALAVAALLAPVVLVPALAAVAVATFRAGRSPRRPARAAGALGLGVAAAVVAGLLSTGGLGPETNRPAAAAAAMSTAAALGVVACLLLVSGLAAGTLSAFRVPAAAVVGGGVAALLPLDRLAMVLVCLPLAAVLAAALVTGLTDDLAERNPVAIRRAVRAGGAVGLAALAATGVVSLIRGPGSPPSFRGAQELLRWTRDELPPSAPVLAPTAEWAQLVRAGADEKQVRLHRSAGDPQLEIVVGASPSGTAVLTQLPSGDGQPTLSVVDRRPGVPTAAEMIRRRSLAAAILANPTTTTGARAASVLRAASVDQRLLTLLAALAAQFGVGVRDLPPAAGEPRGMLARHAVVDRIGGQPLAAGSAVTTRLLAWLTAQLPPFHPDSVEVANGGVLIGFRYVSAPDALVTRATP